MGGWNDRRGGTIGIADKFAGKRTLADRSTGLTAGEPPVAQIEPVAQIRRAVKKSGRLTAKAQRSQRGRGEKEILAGLWLSLRSLRLCGSYSSEHWRASRQWHEIQRIGRYSGGKHGRDARATSLDASVAAQGTGIVREIGFDVY